MRTTALCAALAVVALGACASIQGMIGTPPPAAVATLAPASGSSVTGTVSFAQQGGKVLVRADVSGLPPGGHGFHVHENGDCSAADATSAGGHFNPLAKPHGNPGLGEHHAGDMPMLEADASGHAKLNVVLEPMSLGGGAADVIGKSVVVHKDVDDYKTQPAGNSGARIACGVIRKS